ncbi:hypothetical protein [Halostagnicola larsenii]|uniref:hypothetical protein n=1 Tax=Halostagnicola larsenii TaxID=353800 RepID=UPI0012F97C9A|nr:hypothetical protein [Halostagnicola larsenii]
MSTENAPDGVDATKTFALRRGNALTLADDHVYVDRGDDTPIRFAFEDIVEVQYDSFDWFLAVLSVILVLFGGYSTTENVLGGLGFAAAGVGSFYLTYRKRGKLSFNVTGRSKPLIVYPEHSEAAYEAFRPHMSE